MPKVTPLPVPHRPRSAAATSPVRLLVDVLQNWLADNRRRRSLRRIPTELLSDVLPDEDIRTHEQLRRAPKRVDTGLWF
ncbi:hypothetical protein [Roseibium sp. MMSF_3412]|uniref:hypothetical protein n=1 Tax=Roseibium sp. MMSF_3412 TaxID=3046712 RepID=UPI00273EFEA8|nr:hypothetical protein [Roseibium sp. MMSF_3412]